MSPIYTSSTARKGGVVGSGWKFVGVLIGDPTVRAIEGLIADQSAVFSMCVESAFGLEALMRATNRLLGRHRWVFSGDLGGEPPEGILKIFRQALAMFCLTGYNAYCLISMGHKNRQ